MAMGRVDIWDLGLIEFLFWLLNVLLTGGALWGMRIVFRIDDHSTGIITKTLRDVTPPPSNKQTQVNPNHT